MSTKVLVMKFKDLECKNGQLWRQGLSQTGDVVEFIPLRCLRQVRARWIHHTFLPPLTVLLLACTLVATIGFVYWQPAFFGGWVLLLAYLMAPSLYGWYLYTRRIRLELTFQAGGRVCYVYPLNLRDYADLEEFVLHVGGEAKKSTEIVPCVLRM